MILIQENNRREKNPRELQICKCPLASDCRLGSTLRQRKQFCTAGSSTCQPLTGMGLNHLHNNQMLHSLQSSNAEWVILDGHFCLGAFIPQSFMTSHMSQALLK